MRIGVQVIAGIVAIGILVAIFVPFQKANAFSASTTGLGGTTHQSTVTSFPFNVQLNVLPGEHMPVQEISFTLDGSSSPYTFDIQGNLVHGSPNGVISMGAPSANPTNAQPYAYSYSYSYALSSSSVPGFTGPATVTYPVTINPSLLTPGSHTLQVNIATGLTSGLQLITTTPVTFTVTNSAGTGTLVIEAKDLGNAALPGSLVELRKGLTIVDAKYTQANGKATFTVTAGEQYTVSPGDDNAHQFTSWTDTSSTIRGRVVSVASGQTTTLTASYNTVGVNQKTLSVVSKTTTGTTITGVFDQLAEGSSLVRVDGAVVNYAGTNFTPNSYLVHPNTAYTIFASDSGQYVFDHWENAANPGTPLPTAVNLRGTAVNISANTTLVAVYRVNPASASVSISSSLQFTQSLSLPGLPGIGQLSLDIVGSIGSGLLHISNINSSSLPSIVLVRAGNIGTLTTILEVDTSSMQLSDSGGITFRIPFELPSGVTPTASNVKVFHYDGTNWVDITVPNSLVVGTPSNTGTVQGRLVGSSASPIAVAYSQPSSSPPSSGGSGGGGGGSVIINPSFPPDYFSTNPLAKIQVQDSSFKNLEGNTVFGAKPGQQVSINASFKNYQQTPQNYAMIVQIVDQNGFTTDIGWVTGTVDAGKTVNNARSWTPDASGNYTIKIFVWDNVDTTPLPLSEITAKYFSVSE